MVCSVDIFGFEDYKKGKLIKIENSPFYELQIKELAGYFFIINFSETSLNLNYPENLNREHLFFIVQKKNDRYSINTLAPLYLENNTLSQKLFPEIQGVTLLAPFVLNENDQYQRSAEL
jgi:flagellar assembly factor FliW